MHFLSRTAAALALSGACFLAGSGSALAAQTASLSVDATPSESSASISPLLYGIFLEDINFAVDGGMYAELIKNGSFEYGMLAKNSGKHNYSMSDKSAVTLEVIDGKRSSLCRKRAAGSCQKAGTGKRKSCGGTRKKMHK